MWLLLTICASSLLAANILYNLLFHPLARVPGPLLARISPLWIAWQCKQNRRPALDGQLHRQYGSIVRISPNEVIFSNPAYFKTVYGAGSSRTWGRSIFLTAHNQFKGNYDRLNMLLEIDMDKVRVQKRVFGPVYSTANAVKHEELIDNNDRRWAERLGSLKGQVLDFYPELELLAVDLFTELTFGEAFGAVERGSDGGQQESMAKRWSWIGWVGFLPWLCKLQHELMKRNVPFSQFKLPFPVNAWAAEKMAQYESVASENEEKPGQDSLPPGFNATEKFKPLVGRTVINTSPTAVPETSRQKGAAVNKFKAPTAHTVQNTSSHAVPVTSGREGASVPCLHDDLQIVSKTKPGVGTGWPVDMAMTNIGAGIDTTSWTLASVVASVCSNPAAYKKLQAELDDALKSGLIKKNTPISYDAAATLPYLQACMSEAMRVWPNIAVSLGRTVPREGIMIDGHFVPSGHVVGMNSRILAQSEEVFGPETEFFHPERWLEASKEKLNDMESRNLAFGGPSRKCPGKNLAWVAMSKLLAGLFTNFEVEVLNEMNGAPGPGGRRWVEVGSFPTKWEGIEVRVQPR